jgi:hypothetical protein
MAFAETTLAAACAATDKTIVVASATSIVAGRRVVIDGEVMQVTKDYVSGVTVGVIRGQDGTAQVAHISGVRVTHGDGSDWGNPGVGVPTNYPAAGLTVERRSYSGTVTIDLPKPGTYLDITLVGAAGAFTVPVPTKELDGCRIAFSSDTAAAHTVTFTGGLGGNGASSDVATFHASQKQAFEVIARNETWAQLGGLVAGAATVAGVGLA